ncbi:hypothetical protein HNR05_000282 [Leifsonia psychrotolerans]|uniref:Uncharacterized protein n=1 Tax=Glaciibacter psychrotolerans TaxID=670054 RepID=A0A7Z0EBB6_9MICO|nr:hypothetical protein [Leifsonia psychrotolerans]
MQERLADCRCFSVGRVKYRHGRVAKEGKPSGLPAPWVECVARSLSAMNTVELMTHWKFKRQSVQRVWRNRYYHSTPQLF